MFFSKFSIKASGYLKVFYGNFFPQFSYNIQITLHLKPPWNGSNSHYMHPIAEKSQGVLDHNEDAGEGNEENIEEVMETFILMKGNLSV